MTLLVLLLQPCMFAVMLWLVLRYLQARDTARDAALQELTAREQSERQILLQRIQAPQQAVVEHAYRDQPVPDGSPRTEQEAAVASDDQVLQQILEMERMQQAEMRSLGMVAE